MAMVESINCFPRGGPFEKHGGLAKDAGGCIGLIVSTNVIEATNPIKSMTGFRRDLQNVRKSY